MKIKSVLFYCLSVLVILSCKKEPDPIPPVRGCMDRNSLNFDSLATETDGSCMYADRFVPLTAGSYWILRDTIPIPIIGGTAPVEVRYDATKDTIIDGKTYTLYLEVLTASTLYNSITLFANRFDPTTGKAYRRNITTGDSLDRLFLDYPLGLNDLGKIWYDSPAEDKYKFTLLGITTVVVPTGTYTPVIQVQVQDLVSNLTTTIYFAKNVGPVMADITVTYLGFPISAQPELVEFHLN